MSRRKHNDIVKLLSKNLLAVSILLSTLVVSGTLIYVFGGNSNIPSVAGGAPTAGTGGVIPSGGGGGIGIDNLKVIARAVGAEGDEFDSCLDSGKYTSDVSAEASYGSSLGVNGTPSFFINGVSVVGAVPFEQIASIIDGALAGTPNHQAISVDTGDSPVLGDSNAPVTIVEFSDYECPFCGRFFLSTLPQIKSTYIDTGKAKLVYKDFPLTSLHPDAQKAAEAARCVRDQLGDSGYWEMHNQIFSAAS